VIVIDGVELQIHQLLSLIKVLGFEMQKILVITEMGEFRKFWTGIRLFDWSIDSFLYEIWLQLNGDLVIEYS